MFAWLDRLADESHRSETVAGRWHRGHALAYWILIAGYVCMSAWHLAAAARHARTARFLESARRASSGVAADDDQGC